MNVLCRRWNVPINIYRAVSQETRVTCMRKCLYHVINNTPQISVLNPLDSSYSILRYKSKKAKQQDLDSDDEADKIDDDYTMTRDSKLVKFSGTSLRTDMVLKSALGIARNKIEELFYESKIRVNGKKILKKSTPVKIDYEIDIIKSVSSKNPDHLFVSRVIIVDLKAKEESIAITVRRFKNLLIENYETDPYKGSSTENDK